MNYICSCFENVINFIISKHQDSLSMQKDVQGSSVSQASEVVEKDFLSAGIPTFFVTMTNS